MIIHTTKEEVIAVTACRECHREDHHQLSCSHVRYESRLDIAPQDEVAADHVPTAPYCPGPDIACYFAYARISGFVCEQTGTTACYYGGAS